MTVRSAGHAEAISQDFAERFAGDVEFYLAQDPRQLPSRYLYDALGSALFEAICLLPWYPLTRTEARLLQQHARAILGAVPSLATILELGAGSGEKLAALLHGAAARRFPDVHLVDISPAALAQATRTLAALGDVPVATHQATYESGLIEFRDLRPAGRALVLFLGSNIGNFDPPGADAFLRTIRSSLRSGDALLLGTDLVKPEPDLRRAYDDPLGVTAAFNRNLLVRINRELGGTFDLDGFAHKAVWNAEESRVEMHLVSLRRQRVTVAAAGLDFEMQEGESIWTESSYKFRREQVSAMLLEAGFRSRAQWTDESGGFALSLAEAR
jgi:L-histidine Nalpha-methyltransferase